MSSPKKRTWKPLYAPADWNKFGHNAQLRRFMRLPARTDEAEFKAAAMFCGSAVGEYGFHQGGFDFVALLERVKERAIVAGKNHPHATIVRGDAVAKADRFVEAVLEGAKDLDLLTVTAPCQGMSHAGHRNGHRRGTEQKPSRDRRNRLSLTGADVVAALRPKVVFLENVQDFERTWVRHEGKAVGLWDETVRRLPGYKSWRGVLQFADYGVPQRRRRFVGILVRDDVEIEPADLVPPATHAPSRNGVQGWPTAKATLSHANYRALDGASAEAAQDPDDPLHRVPIYDATRYMWIANIKSPGKSAYLNPTCVRCGANGVPKGYANCTTCQRRLPRPTVQPPGGRPRLITGHHTSYRRMFAHLPVPTITTSSGHFGSDTKIHPYQNRVLSTREVLDHQTLPPAFVWDFDSAKSRFSLVRECAGEAVPAWFTYRLAQQLKNKL